MPIIATTKEEALKNDASYRHVMKLQADIDCLIKRAERLGIHIDVFRTDARGSKTGAAFTHDSSHESTVVMNQIALSQMWRLGSFGYKLGNPAPILQPTPDGN